MNVITLASRKGGAGKSTLTAHLAACAHAAGRRCLVIDADPQGSLTLWQSLRADGAAAARRTPRAASIARSPSRRIDGFDWVFIDTAPTMWVVVQEAIRAATLVVIPARPGFFDLNAVRETVATARERNKPYAVVLNAAPAKRDDKEAPAVAQSRAFLDKHGIPVWHGQISQRAALCAHARCRRQRLRDSRRTSRGRRRDRGTMVGGRALGRGDQRGACRRPRRGGQGGLS